ncbi:hypothetical protein Pan97_36450 [Bremerella volcania]|uniref:Carboxypeptidase regulatory-like domain-containing protein n=1 Tax=Bremerella volcania TaxID=2527984 RepID=A0A518CBI9_9BACT|nr:carboxypeptidase regulatory-like domain-containing protein [Bremerella volcania]QDU76593.1 hypothetical protein Pan97_36450 [Bremerella volcania]
MLRFIGLTSVAAICAIGCTASDDSGLPRRVPAKAVVTYEGKPVEGATVTFGGAEIRGAVGNTDERGEVRLWTYEPGDGVIPGTYTVAIRKLEVLALPDPEKVSPEEYSRMMNEMNRALGGSPKHLLPKKYSKAETSQLTAEVVDGGENIFTFELED